MINHTYNETCLFCGKKLDLYERFISHDYQMEFADECDACGKQYRVFVETVPEFRMVDEREHQEAERRKCQRQLERNK